jgi:hypothetical protein
VRAPRAGSRRADAKALKESGLDPVVLRGGAIAGVWFPSAKAGRVTPDVTHFGRATPALREKIAGGAEALGRFLGARCEPRCTRDTI